MANENFNTYTEVNPGGKITSVTPTRVTYVDARRDDVDRIYKDFGETFFNRNLTHQYEIYFENGTQFGLIFNWMLTNSTDDYGTIVAASGDLVAVYAYHNGGSNYSIRILMSSNGAITQDNSIEISASTLYYITVNRDYDGGVNNTGRYTVSIRTGSHAGTLVDTLILDSPVGEQNSYRYLFAGCAPGLSTQTSKELDMYVQNLNLNLQAAVDPYENFLTYNRADPGGNIVTTSTKVEAENLAAADGVAYVVKDFGVDYFNSDFIHRFEVNKTAAWSGTNPSIWYWTIANHLGDWSTMLANGPSAFVHGFTNQLRLFFQDADDNIHWVTTTISQGTNYFCTVTYDRDGGENSTGRFILTIRTGSHAGSVVSSKFVDAGVGEQYSYRYLYPMMIDSTVSNRVMNAYTRNLNLNVSVNISKFMSTPLPTVSKIFGLAKTSIKKIMGTNI